MNEARVFKVVVADDSSVVRERIVAMLCELPRVAVVAESSDVHSALEYVREFEPDLVILDWSMPGGSGIDVLRTVSREELNTQVIVLTNYALPEYAYIARNAGALAFFSKSDEFTNAIDMVREMAAKKQ